MKVIFLGVGEAFDEELVNNCHLVQSTTTLLLDCGYSIPRHLWKHYPDQEYLDAVYLSHAHADHYMGLPILLARMWEEKRTAPLKVISHTSVLERIPSLTDHAYPGLLDRLPFPVEFICIHEGATLNLNELVLDFAPSHHSVSNYAVRVICNGRRICYSGDGVFTELTRELYKGADLVIHECYTLEQEIPTHGSIREVIAMCEEQQVKCLALTHLNRTLRSDLDQVWHYIEKHTRKLRVILPNPLDEFALG